jgi:hypothetical protein
MRGVAHVADVSIAPAGSSDYTWFVVVTDVAAALVDAQDIGSTENFSHRSWQLQIGQLVAHQGNCE